MKVMKKYLNIFLKLYSSILNSLLPQCSLFSIEYQDFQLEVCNIRSIDRFSCSCIFRNSMAIVTLSNDYLMCHDTIIFFMEYP
jgi:hypothetical protein